MDRDNSKWRLIDRDGSLVYTYALEIKDLGCLVRVQIYPGGHGTARCEENLTFVPGTELIREEDGDWKIQAIPLPPMPMGFPGGQGSPILIPMMR